MNRESTVGLKTSPSKDAEDNDCLNAMQITTVNNLGGFVVIENLNFVDSHNAGKGNWR